MDWNPLKPGTFRFISESIGYEGRKTKTGELYQKVSKLSCSLEDKVKFILRHWGWNGSVREEAKYIMSKINDVGFTIPIHAEQFFEQMYGLFLPMKKTVRDLEISYGGTLCFRYLPYFEDDFFIFSECLSVKFDDDIIPIGCMFDYNGYSLNALDGWEDPYYVSSGAWCYELYLGNSGKFYFEDQVISDYVGVEAENLLLFFASAFGLIENQEETGERETDEDYERMELIEQLYKEGKYRQNYFRIKEAKRQ